MSSSERDFVAALRAVQAEVITEAQASQAAGNLGGFAGFRV